MMPARMNHPPRGSAHGQWRVITTLATLVLISTVTALGSPSRFAFAAGTEEPAGGIFHPTDRQLHTLTIDTVRPARFEDVILAEGRLGFDSDHATPVYSAYTGRVLEVLAHAGQRVTRGQILARLDASEFSQGLGELRSSAAQLELARTVVQRKRALLEVKGASQQDVEQAEADLATARAAHDAASIHLRSLGATQADLDRMSRAPSLVDLALVRAPIAGILTDRQVGPGQFVQAGNSTPLFTVADTSRIWLWADVRESDAAKVRLGQPVEAELSALTGRKLGGRLDFVSATIDPDTHRLAAHATLDNRDGSLKPQMLATVRIHMGDARTSPSVPESAIVLDGEAARIWVLNTDGSIAARRVSLGRRDPPAVEITSGLRVGERIVTRGALFVDAASQGP